MKAYLLVLALLLGAVFSDSYDGSDWDEDDDDNEPNQIIIIGGGPGGCVAAEQLSANPDINVLLLEQGNDDSDLFEYVVGFHGFPVYGAGARINEVATENAYVQHLFSQEYNLDLTSWLVPAARTMGGGASVNGNAFGRISEADLASWNSSLWTYNSTLTDWKYLEKCTTLGSLSGSPCNPAYHGTSGPIVTKVIEPNELLGKIKNVMPIVYGVPLNDDINGPVATGIGNLPRNFDLVSSKKKRTNTLQDDKQQKWLDNLLKKLPTAEKAKYLQNHNTTLKRAFEQFNGEPLRQEPWTKILKPVLNRPNLKVLTRAKGIKILVKTLGNGKHKLKVVYERDGKIYKKKATLKVILASGIYGTPKILLQSGIGDPTELNAINITPVINNSHVGKNLQDSVISSMIYVSLEAPPPTPNWGGIVIGHYTSSSFTEEGTDMEVAVSSVSPDGGVVLVLLSQLRHNQEGSLKLNSKNHHLDPFFSYNFYSQDSDLDAMVELFKKVRTTMYLANASLYEIKPGYTVVPPDASDEDIRAYFKSSVVIGPEFHGVGTSSLGKVVDDRLQVIGIPEISIFDDSIIPHKLRTHSTSSTSMLIGKVGSRFVKEDLNI